MFTYRCRISYLTNNNISIERRSIPELGKYGLEIVIVFHCGFDLGLCFGQFSTIHVTSKSGLQFGLRVYKQTDL